MYNRYIPTQNGSYVRRQVDEPSTQHRPVPQPQPPPVVLVETAPVAEAAEASACSEAPQCKQNFLQRLLPQNIDLGDVLILLILLLLVLDSEEQSDWLTLLLTVAAFLILQ